MDISKTYLAVTPIAKPRMTRADVWKKRPIVVRYRQYKDEIREAYPFDLPDRFQVVFNVPMPNSWSDKKKQEMFGKPHKQRPDIDNLLKGFLDALCEEDSHVYSVGMEKRWALIGSIELTCQTQYNDIEKE